MRALAVAMLALVLAGCSQREALTAADRAGERVAVPAAPVRSFAVGLRRSELRYATARGATRATRLLIWYPTSGVPRNHDYGLQTGLVAQDGAVAEGRWPVVLFSHGFLSGAERSAFITENLARRGYVVAAPDHADGIVDPTPSSPRLPRFTQPEAWDDATFRERREDLVATLDLLEREDAVQRVRELAPKFETAVHSLRGAKHVADIRNVGLAAGITLNAAPGEPAKRPWQVAMAMYAKGFYVRYSGDTVAFAPPFVSTPAEVDRFVAALGETLDQTA